LKQPHGARPLTIYNRIDQIELHSQSANAIRDSLLVDLDWCSKEITQKAISLFPYEMILWSIDLDNKFTGSYTQLEGDPVPLPKLPKPTASFKTVRRTKMQISRLLSIFFSCRRAEEILFDLQVLYIWKR